MFQAIPTAPKDQIFSLIQAYNNDQRTDKINLLSGVYRDESGNVPILSSVKAAENLILKNETSKDYFDISGSNAFAKQVLGLLHLAKHPASATLQTPGGTGALRIIAEFIQRFFSTATVWISNPTWPNHQNIFESCHLAIKEYPYYNKANKALLFDEMLSSLSQAKAGDFILLHACCHNPTGADLSLAQWQKLAKLMQEKQLFPIFDFAYQGFADGLNEDLAGISYFVEQGMSMFIANSFSKNFGLYNERIGALTVVCDNTEALDHVFGQMKYIIRGIYSNPPAHGALIVSTILGQPELRKQWDQDLDTMRHAVHQIRRQFAEKLSEVTQRDYHYISQQKGLFSYVDVTPAQAISLRNDHGVYLLDSGRINLTGLNANNLMIVCNKIAAVLKS